MSKIACLIIIILYQFSLNAQSNESDYSNYIQSLIGGEREVSIKGGRIDLLTSEYAFEVEWASNWKEAIGQSIWYGLNTQKKPGIILLLKSKSDYKYFIQLNTALEYAKLEDEITVYLFPNDFEKSVQLIGG